MSSTSFSRLELEAVRSACQRRVRRVAWVSAAGAVVPVPLLDIAVDVGVLMKLIPEINQQFGLAPADIDALPEASRARVWLRRAERGSELIGMVVTRGVIRRSLEGFAGRLVTRQITKYVPLAGTVISASLGYWVMRQLAYRHIDDCFEVALAAQGQRA